MTPAGTRGLSCWLLDVLPLHAAALRLGVVGKAAVLLGLGRPESRVRRLGGGRRARTARLVAAVEHKVLNPLLTA